MPTLLDVSSAVINAVFGAVFRTRVHGLENIPRSGPAIIAINHASYFDPPLVGGQIARVRPFKALGKGEMYKVPVLGHYLRAIGSIPVDRDRPDHGAMRQSLEFLADGHLFLMAPEGTRGTAARKRVPKPGVGFLAHHSGAPVIPTRIEGTAWPPRPGRVWIRFGEPMRFDAAEAEGAGTKKAYQDFAQRLMDRIYGMREN